ncbi:MAG: ATP-binding cassette domain-containing protein [Arhodomonas sp.]|nr:ATP-binding cassette domain-containing protein [Arhodomonas sp.]
MNAAKSWFTGCWPSAWLFALGGALRAGHPASCRAGIVGPVRRSSQRRSDMTSMRSRESLQRRPGRSSMLPRVDISRGGVRAPPAGPILYRARIVTVSFDGFKALNELTLYVDDGELRCIIGPNGAGKTTMMDVITGMTVRDQGSVLVRPAHRSAAAGSRPRSPTAYRPQVPDAHGVPEPRRGREPGARHWRRDKRGVAERVRPARRGEHATGIDDGRYDRPAWPGAPGRRRQLSHGQKQWLEIGMLLMQNPRVLLVDEPVAGMSQQEMDQTGELLQRLAGHHSVIVVEHDMAFVASIIRAGNRASPGQRARGGEYGQGPERPAGGRGVPRRVAAVRGRHTGSGTGFPPGAQPAMWRSPAAHCRPATGGTL